MTDADRLALQLRHANALSNLTGAQQQLRAEEDRRMRVEVELQEATRAERERFQMWLKADADLAAANELIDGLKSKNTALHARIAELETEQARLVRQSADNFNQARSLEADLADSQKVERIAIQAAHKVITTQNRAIADGAELLEQLIPMDLVDAETESAARTWLARPEVVTARSLEVGHDNQEEKATLEQTIADAAKLFTMRDLGVDEDAVFDGIKDWLARPEVVTARKK